MDNSDRVTQEGYNGFHGSYANGGYGFTIGLPNFGNPVVKEFAGGGYRGSKCQTERKRWYSSRHLKDR